MKAFYVFLFLTLIGLVFANDIFDRGSCTYPPSCNNIIDLVKELLELLDCINIVEICPIFELPLGLCCCLLG
ncbi:hypothetical protein ALC56_10223 [Trachymyrmex septentrionalis]|uniref:Uncharacterized protein n=1 Tax=Trachymyrmex septentrionalis TaxID=34720 RepID=A0A195F4J4_9HYME|nr:hypothetical protein ALC56_10223 [Trachymyrmex septentrionalis]